MRLVLLIAINGILLSQLLGYAEIAYQKAKIESSVIVTAVLSDK